MTQRRNNITTKTRETHASKAEKHAGGLTKTKQRKKAGGKGGKSYRVFGPIVPIEMLAVDFAVFTQEFLLFPKLQLLCVTEPRLTKR